VRLERDCEQLTHFSVEIVEVGTPRPPMVSATTASSRRRASRAASSRSTTLPASHRLVSRSRLRADQRRSGHRQERLGLRDIEFIRAQAPDRRHRRQMRRERKRRLSPAWSSSRRRTMAPISSRHVDSSPSVKEDYGRCVDAKTPPMMTTRICRAAKKLAVGSLQCPGQRVAGAPHLWQLRCGYRLCCNFRISGSAARVAALQLLRCRWST
jgi:hypothetical protein